MQLKAKLKLENNTFTYASIKGDLNKHVNLGGFYARNNKHKFDNTDFKNLYGFSTDVNFDKVWVGGEYVKGAGMNKGTAWTAGIGYGAYDQAKQGTWDVKAQYFKLWSIHGCCILYMGLLRMISVKNLHFMDSKAGWQLLTMHCKTMLV